MNAETLAQISAALGVPVSEITGNDGEEGGETDGKSLVVLQRYRKGTDIINILLTSYAVKLTLDTEPSEEWIEDTAALLDEIDALSPAPFSSHPSLTSAGRLRRGAALTKLLEKLTEGDVGLYVGLYTALERTPVWDADEGRAYTPRNSEPELVQYAMVRVARAGPEKISVQADNKYVPPVTETFSDDLEDEIPF
jgi:hypothetical protein